MTEAQKSSLFSRTNLDLLPESQLSLMRPRLVPKRDRSNCSQLQRGVGVVEERKLTTIQSQKKKQLLPDVFRSNNNFNQSLNRCSTSKLPNMTNIFQLKMNRKHSNIYLHLFIYIIPYCVRKFYRIFSSFGGECLTRKTSFVNMSFQR